MFSRAKLALPKPSKNQIFLIFFLFLTSLLQTGLTHSYNLQSVLLDRLSFLSLCFLFFQAFKAEKLSLADIALPITASALCVSGYGIFQFINLKEGENFYFHIASTFGHANMAAQFLGFAVLFQIHLLFTTSKQWLKICLISAIAIQVTYIYLSWCRSTWLGLGLCLFLLLLHKRKEGMKSFIQAALATICLIMILQFHQGSKASPQQHLQAKNEITSMKQGNTRYRLEMWKETLQMIADHPLGVGPGNFEFNYLPYKKQGLIKPEEQYVERSPHNEFLRFIVEDGWLAFMLLATVVTWICWKGFRQVKNPDDQSLLKMLFLFLGVEMFFQFPIENAFPFYLFSALIGYFFSKIWKWNSFILIPQLNTAFVLPLLCALIFLTAKKTISYYWLTHAEEDYGKIARACNLFPSNWRSCILKSQLELDDGQFEKAIQTTNSILKKSPFHYPALELHALASLEIGNAQEACQSLNRYDWIFDEKSSLHAMRMSKCLESKKVSLKFH